ncbi:alpha/beta fold hydrolase [Micromonospora zamorensis]|uniref:alpha/beta fold hydrolase n=1 Tax=Micromonospora zamorensis TaxID=709883 RepID=UPI003D99D0D6
MDIYHETHGNDEGRPLVLIHGALAGIGTSFGTILPALAKSRRVIAVELQAHGHTRTSPVRWPWSTSPPTWSSRRRYKTAGRGARVGARREVSPPLVVACGRIKG